jgi:photosystem II stability/assembly factor-like uncharacterized protein
MHARLSLLSAIVLSLGCCVFLPGCVQFGCDDDHLLDSESESVERPDSPIEAAMMRYQARLNEDGVIPDDALIRAKAQRDALIQRQGLGGGVSSARWTWLGPGNIGGRIRPVIFDHTDSNTIYVGGASGGIWKTTNGGAHWEPLDDFMATLAIGCMAIDPVDPNVLYAGTGEGFFETVEGTSNTAAVRGAGIFRSLDAGSTWQQIESTATPDFHFVNRIAIDPTDPSILIAATGTGIWRSTDAGATWSRRSTFNALDVKMHPTLPSRLVAGGHHADDGPYYSTDGGLTWSQATGAGGHRQELAYAPSNPSIVYAAVSGSDDRIKVWRSTNGGQTYTIVTTGSGINTYASYNNTLWIDPTNPDFLILGGVYLYRSTNAGATFSQRFNDVHPDMHNIVEHPNFDGSSNRTVYFATDGGLWRTDDVYGTNAIDLNNNLGITQFYGAAINPTTGHVAGGTQDNGSLSYQGDPQNWLHYFGGDGGYGAADPTDPNYFYGEVQRAYIHRSTNGGQSASYIWNTANPIGDAGSSTRSNFIPFYMLDPNNANRMLVGCRLLWRSNNVKAGSPDWFAIKPEISDPGPEHPRSVHPAHFAPNDPRNISTIEVASGNSDRIWVGHNNGQIWITNNGTAGSPTWTRVDENGGNVLPDRWVSTIVINPNNHAEVYVAFMGWADDNIWKTTDGGQTWRNISGSGATAIPPAPASAMNIHPTRHGWLYVGSDLGVFTSMDDGATWNVTTDGPGTVPVEQLIWKDGDELMAVTHGRGVYLAEVAGPASLDSFTMVTGTLLGGTVGDLNASDDVAIRTRSGFGQTFIDLHNMTCRLSATTDLFDAAAMHLAFETRINQPAGTAQIRLRNWATNQMTAVGSFALGATDARRAIGDIAAADYIGASGQIEVEIKHLVFVPIFAFQFESFIDMVEIAVE